jgi:integrase
MPMPIRELFERYSLLKGLDRKTIALYSMLADRLDRFFGRPVTTRDLDDMQVGRFLRWRAETPGWRGRLPSAATVRKDQNMIQAAWRYAARKKIAREFPDLAPVRVPKRLAAGRAYTIDDVSKLVRRARRRFGRTGGLPSSWWWSTLIYAAVCSGERFTALSSVRWADVDLERRRMIFRGETRKGRTRDIERQITAELADMLAQQRRGPTDLVWPWDRRSRRPVPGLPRLPPDGRELRRPDGRTGRGDPATRSRGPRAPGRIRRYPDLPGRGVVVRGLAAARPRGPSSRAPGPGGVITRPGAGPRPARCRTARPRGPRPAARRGRRC